METDSDLLARYAAKRDPMAFTELTRRYRSLVFNSAKRVAGNFHDAEDITQSCFVDLALEANKVKGPLAGWLHLRATNRALMARRSDVRRQKREQSAAAPEESPLTEATWELVGPLVDETIEQLPEELRLPLILYYLQEFSQEEVAHTLKVSRRAHHADAGSRRQSAAAPPSSAIGDLSIATSGHARYAKWPPPR